MVDDQAYQDSIKGKESSRELVAGANFKHTNSAPTDPKPTKSIRKRTSAARLLSFTGWALCARVQCTRVA
jgi:hypothetical protein